MNIVVIVLQILLGAAFLGSGFSKVTGNKMQVDNFNALGLPQWFRVLTGLLQLAGAGALIAGFWLPSWLEWGALLLAIIMFGAVFFHVKAGDSFGKAVPALVLTLLAAALLALRFSELSAFPG
ncbi:DoxX family protein [Paenibacillus sp. D51F]